MIKFYNKTVTIVQLQIIEIIVLSFTLDSFYYIHQFKKYWMLEYFEGLDAFLISIFYQILLQRVNFVGGKKRLYVIAFSIGCTSFSQNNFELLYLIVSLPKNGCQKYLNGLSTKNEMILGFYFISIFSNVLSMTCKDFTLFV